MWNGVSERVEKENINNNKKKTKSIISTLEMDIYSCDSTAYLPFWFQLYRPSVRASDVSNWFTSKDDWIDCEAPRNVILFNLERY